jgi:hypothetical protein
MVKPATILVTIDESLRYVLYGISVLLNVELSAREIERLFSDARAGESPAGPYVFHESPGRRRFRTGGGVRTWNRLAIGTRESVSPNDAGAAFGVGAARFVRLGETPRTERRERRSGA